MFLSAFKITLAIFFAPVCVEAYSAMVNSTEMMILSLITFAISFATLCALISGLKDAYWYIRQIDINIKIVDEDDQVVKR